MNPQEFETEVRKLRQLQRRFFSLRKDDQDRGRILEMVREQEKLVGEVVDIVMARRPTNKKPDNEREAFFLDVTEMLRRQRSWMKYGGSGYMMYPAHEQEKKVDNQLQSWNEQRKEERKKRIEQELKKQTSLFDETDC